MNYSRNRVLFGVDIDAADQRVRNSLRTEGFGVLTEIKVQETIKQKINVEMGWYRNLGTCNPKIAYEAVGFEPPVGAMLPCNVILRETDQGIEISAIDPVASMAAIENPALISNAGKVPDLLRQAVNHA